MALRVFADMASRLIAAWRLSRQTPDQSILRDLKREGIQANLYVIRQIRWKNQMKRRARTVEEQEERLNQAMNSFNVIFKEAQQPLDLVKVSFINMSVSRAKSQRRLYDIYRAAFPEEVASRRDGNFKQRGDFKVLGPNFLWSLDGCEKLKKFGFQIYGCIDAYSRCIIWFFVGRSATTSIRICCE